MDTLSRTQTICPMTCLGIDPGLTGAWALLRPTGELVRMGPMPRLADGDLDGQSLAEQWRACSPIRLTAVELVHAMPGQGVTSMFTFGQVCGVILGVLASLGHVPVRPTPQRWQKALGVHLAADCPETDKAARRKLVKARAAETAAQLLGDQAGQLMLPRCRTVHDGLVDAVLIAEWLRRNATDVSNNASPSGVASHLKQPVRRKALSALSRDATLHTLSDIHPPEIQPWDT